MAQSFSLPFRQIHLDFHTSEAIADVGVQFDAKAFARTMKAAHVNSVTVFAKCHHGHLYYNTKHPARHPGLKRGLDLLRRQVDALHDQGIRAPIYISVQCDEYAANTHPEWIARNPDGTNVGPKPVRNPLPNSSWQILDMSSPYQEYLAEQTHEVLKLFKPVDGIFFDMCWDQVSVGKWAVAGMTKCGMNPESANDRATYAHNVAIAYMERFYRLVKQSSSQATCFFNCRPMANLAEDIPHLTQVEIEALPTGGWGYMYFPKNVRFARTFNRPYMGMTARFHKSWADFGGIKPYAALEYETSQMMAHGARCSIGDQLHPRGYLDQASYDLIGKVYERVEQREPWLIETRPISQVGLFRVPTNEYHGGGFTDNGATRMLTQLKHQFDLVDEQSEFDKYKLLILPDAIPVSADLARQLQAYVKAGGSLLLSGTSGMSSDGTQLTFPALGVKPQGTSPFQTTYIRFGKDVNRGVPAADHVMYECGIRVTPGPRTKVLAQVVEPYFDRAWNHFSSHCQTPSAQVSRFPAATLNGRVAYISFPIFAAFAKHGNYPYRLLVSNIIDLLMPNRLLRITAPTSTETSVMKQGKRTIVHVLQYAPERRAEGLDILEDIVPLHDVPMSLMLAKKPANVYLAPEMKRLEFSFGNGRCDLVIPEVNGHAMVVFE